MNSGFARRFRRKQDALRMAGHQCLPNKNQWKDDDSSIHESAIYSMWMHITEYVHFTQNGWSPTKGKLMHTCYIEFFYIQMCTVHMPANHNHMTFDAASTTFNPSVDNNQYSGRRRLKFLKNLSNGIVTVPKVVHSRSLLPDFNIASDSDCEQEEEEDDDDNFVLKSNLLNRTIDSVSSSASSAIELDEYLLQVSPTTIADGSFDHVDHHYLEKLHYPRPSVRAPPGLNL